MKVDRITLEPGLDVLIYSHDLWLHNAASRAWTMVTSGLSAFKHREITLTILRTDAANDSFPKGVLNYVPALKHFAEQGRILNSDDISGYRAPGPFQLAGFVGLAFFEAPPIAGVGVPIDALTGLFLTEAELAMASRCSVRRVLNQLGKSTRHFPVPNWSDPLRASVYAPGDADQSILTKLPSVKVRRATATLQGEVIRLSIPRSFSNALIERITNGESSAVLPGWNPASDAALVWSPGQQEPEAIFADGTQPSMFAVNYVALVPSDSAQNQIRFIEDGYVALLSLQSKRELLEALGKGMPYTFHDSDQTYVLQILVT